jgi:hypothetical protein
LDDGLIGDLVQVQVWGVEQLLHMGWHPIYLQRYFAGEPLWSVGAEGARAVVAVSA